MNTENTLRKTLAVINRSCKIIDDYKIPEIFKSKTTTKYMSGILNEVAVAAGKEPVILVTTVFGIVASIDVGDDTIMFTVRRGKSKPNTLAEGVASHVGKGGFKANVVSDNELDIITDDGIITVNYLPFCEFNGLKLVSFEGLCLAINLDDNVVYTNREILKRLVEDCIERQNEGKENTTPVEKDKTVSTLFENFLKEVEYSPVMKRTVEILEKRGHFIEEISQTAIKHVYQGFTFHTFIGIDEPVLSVHETSLLKNRMFAQTNVRADTCIISDREKYLLLNTGGVASVFTELTDIRHAHTVRYYEGILSIHIRIDNGQKLMSYMIPSSDTPSLEVSTSLSIVFEETGTVADLKALFRLCKK